VAFKHHHRASGIARDRADPVTASFWRKMLAFSPGLPRRGRLHGSGQLGHRQSPAAHGSCYTLLNVIMLSNLMASCCRALGGAAGRGTSYDLAQACAPIFPPAPWCSGPLAEMMPIGGVRPRGGYRLGRGAEPALRHPLAAGVVITALECSSCCSCSSTRFRILEGIVLTLILGIAGGFAIEAVPVETGPGRVLGGFVPSPEILRKPGDAATSPSASSAPR